MSVFSLFLSLGAVAGLLIVAVRAPKKLTTRYIDAGIGILLCAMVGSRLVYAFAHWSYYGTHVGEIFQVWLGGLTGSGAVVGALIGIIFLRLVQSFYIGPLADGLLPLLGAMSMAAWLGCWTDGSAYGAASTAWYALPVRDEWGRLALRVPVQLLGALPTLGLFAGLEQTRQWLRRPGLEASLGLLGVALIALGLSLLRADPAQTWLGLRQDTWEGLVMAGIALPAAAVLLLPRRHRAAIPIGKAALKTDETG